MPDVTTFFTVMAALSAAVQTFVEHVIKKNIKKLDEEWDADNDRYRHVLLHAIVFFVGAALAWSVGLQPLTYLGVEQGPFANASAAGLLVSFGGSFFDEALGAIREFKKAQEQVRKAQGS